MCSVPDVYIKAAWYTQCKDFQFTVQPVATGGQLGVHCDGTSGVALSLIYSNPVLLPGHITATLQQASNTL